MLAPDIQPRDFPAVRPLVLWRPGGQARLVRQLLFLVAAAVVFWVSGRAIGLSAWALVQGVPHIVNLVARMLPPDPAILPTLVGPTIDTLAIALWGTALATLMAFPLACLAARNLTPHPAVYAAARVILNSQRGVSEIVFALIFVAAVGLGAFPGVLALAVHSAGGLGKFYAEAIENIDPGPVEALAATGAGTWQTIAFAIWPQILPEVVTYTLYRWESDVRAAFVLGIVGAGGLGFELQMAMRLFRYQETLMILGLMIVVVTALDWGSSRLRARII
ncbi:MAG TPA: phosphonate ABC transporter, permease protein PhnE [Chloroflexota bacterium]